MISALDLVRRDFTRRAPNELWMTDITEHPTREGKVYCSIVLDAFSRKVVGWRSTAPDDRARTDRARDGNEDPQPR